MRRGASWRAQYSTCFVFKVPNSRKTAGSSSCPYIASCKFKNEASMSSANPLAKQGLVRQTRLTGETIVMTKTGIILIASMFLYGLCWPHKRPDRADEKLQQHQDYADDPDANPGTAWDIRKNYFLRMPVEREVGPSTGTGF
jgi:hypothetical protein